MISPYVRRLRLGWEIERHRKAAGLTHAQLSTIVGGDRAKLSRLEGGKTRPDLDYVIRVLDALKVDGETWSRLTTIAREATERGWWEVNGSRMGERQALIADLEAGACLIREYQQTFIPGLLQTEAYVRALTQYDDLSVNPTPTSPDAVVRARAGRQRMFRRPDGPRLEVIIDEVVLHRVAVPREILADQLRTLAHSDENVEVRVLPVRVEMASPRSSFTLYDYPDPEDPTVAAVDTVTRDVILTSKNDTERYEQQWHRLREAALPAGDSAELLAKVADELQKGRS